MTEREIFTICDIFGKNIVPSLIAESIDETGTVQKEFEKRYKLKSVPSSAKNPSEIRQGLLIEKPGFYLRVREEKQAETKYTLTLKFFAKNDEAEVEITKEMFNKLWPEVPDDKRMEKTRHRLGRWEIDDIRKPSSKKGVVAEIELKSEDEKVTLPKEIEELLI